MARFSLIHLHLSLNNDDASFFKQIFTVCFIVGASDALFYLYKNCDKVCTCLLKLLFCSVIVYIRSKNRTNNIFTFMLEKLTLLRKIAMNSKNNGFELKTSSLKIFIFYSFTFTNPPCYFCNITIPWISCRSLYYTKPYTVKPFCFVKGSVFMSSLPICFALSGYCQYQSNWIFQIVLYFIF